MNLSLHLCHNHGGINHRLFQSFKPFPAETSVLMFIEEPSDYYPWSDGGSQSIHMNFDESPL